MDKFVYLLYGGSYEDCTINAVQDRSDVFIFQPFGNGIIKKLQILHNARPLNKRRELPFKTVWFRRALKGMNLKREESVYFLLYESFHLAYSRNFLVYLKERFPNCKVCFMYLNPVTELISGKLEKVEDCLDGVITFNEKDAKQYNLMFAPLQPYKLPIYENKDIPKSDVFFVGADKGRLEKLLAIYEKLTDAGLKCDFHIVGVAEEAKRYSDSIVYNKAITYQEVLERVNASKCVLEVLQNDEDYLSIRTFEALQYHKKLLTESKSVLKQEFYNPKIVQVFDDPKTIDTEFIAEDIDESVFLDSSFDNVNIFHKALRENIQA